MTNLPNPLKPTFSISFSEYSTFQQCPHKWFLNYVLKIPGDTNEELLFGSSIHDTIETLLIDKILSKMAGNMTVVESVFKDNLKQQIMSITDLVTLKKMQEGWVAPTFIKQANGLFKELNIMNRFKEYTVEDVEIKLDGMPIIELEDATLVYKGFIDLVLKHKETGRYLIIDWKTSRKKWDIKAKEADDNFYTQLKLYRHFYSLKKGIPLDMIDLAFYNLPREEPASQLMYRKEFTNEEISDFIESFADKCTKLYNFNHFQLDKMKITTKKNFCFRCPYNNIAMCNDTDQYQIVDFGVTNR